ncbi:hypothetical protein BGZ70_010138 [Mortierella alpina]|uniref:U3 small nucleolar ribonucleoprotein protein MPP10 n=1 Tax=Mortierella alpina TaxID=64518 RepID=A0A9P6LZK2_MORAP|nr:hypothetical protein BGZ70_010138 [Mortierella alpina]
MVLAQSMPDEALLKSFNEHVLEKPEVFLSRTEASADQAKTITKYLYDLGKATETDSLKGQGSMLEELFVDGFDNDQIWEEIHMQNTPFLSYLKSEIKNLKTSKSSEQSADAGEDDEEEEEDEDMNLGLDEEEMGVDMDDTDNMDGFSGEDGEMDGLGSDQDEDDEEEDAEDHEEEEEDDEEEEEDLDDLDLPVKKRSKTSEVDDDFFNLEEFNAMTEKQEQDELDEKEPDENEEEIDYFADPDLIDSGDEHDDFGDDMDENENEVDAHDVGYKDFFEPLAVGKTNRPKPKPRKEQDEGFFGKDAKKEQEKEEDMEMKDAEEDEEDEESAMMNALGDRVSNLFGLDEAEAESETLSKHEKMQRKLKAQIEALEQENVAARDWTKKGEASSSDRPVNSLLEEDLDFETVSKPIPVITAESTKTLEDIIKERILAANWDDVVRKAAPNPKAFNPSSRIEISDEKSKKSLSELYEDDYVRQTSTTGPVLSEREAALEKKHEEITGLWQDLCQKLDSLSNWHYTPKPPKAELTVVTNAPAISMEEAIPVSVADASLLAPEEVYSAGKAPVKGDTELEQAERKRKRSAAKRAKKAENKERAQRDAERQAEREAKDRRLGRQVGDKGNAKTIVRDKMDAVKALSGQKNISFIDREGNKRSSIKGGSKAAEAAKSAKLKL